MIEVEAKVPISKGEFEFLKAELTKKATSLGERTNQDYYYGHPRNAFLRIRKRGGEHSFDIKRRQTIRGIESNIEMEWSINDLAGWKRLLKKLRIEPSLHKTKKSIVFRQKGFIIELNHVRLLGYFLEIERLVKNKDQIKKAKHELVEYFKSLGFPAKRFEPRPYLELLNHV